MYQKPDQLMDRLLLDDLDDGVQVYMLVVLISTKLAVIISTSLAVIISTNLDEQGMYQKPDQLMHRLLLDDLDDGVQVYILVVIISTNLAVIISTN